MQFRRRTECLFLSLLGMMVLSTGCSQVLLPSARSAVEMFHLQLDTGNYDRIYEDADPAFQALGPESSAAHLFSVVHQRLGKVQASDMVGYQIQAGLTEIRVIMRYRSVFDRGTAQEDFIWNLLGSHARLVSYSIDSGGMNGEADQ